MKPFSEVPLLGLFWWGQFVYWRLDAVRYQNRLAVNLCTGVIERFDFDDLVRPIAGHVTIAPPLHRLKPRRP